MIGAGRRGKQGLSGAWGERAAARYALWRGALVIARNVRGPRGEIDLVLRHGWTLVFAEVKARRRGVDSEGLAAVDRAKQSRIVHTALHYLVQTGRDPDALRLRFDVFLVAPGPRRPRVRWLRGAFTADAA